MAPRARKAKPNSGPRTLPVSDYDSDAALYASLHPSPSPRPTRDNLEINLSVLQRYMPSITAISSQAASVVVYNFLLSPQPGWDKADCEGTMFVCSQSSQAPTHTSYLNMNATAGEKRCLFVLNKKSLANLMLDLRKVSMFEVTNDLLIFQLEEGALMGVNQTSQAQPVNCIGLWIHEDEVGTRDKNAEAIRQAWIECREGNGYADLGDVTEMEEAAGPAMRALGKRLSLSELFGKREAEADTETEG